jgi:hypothetical protein
MSARPEMMGSMAAQSFYGHWWLPDRPEDRVPGVLSIADNWSSHLDLVGGFDFQLREERSDGSTVVLAGTDAAPLIHGECERKQLTLLDTFPTTSRTVGFRFDGAPDYQRIHVNRVLVGEHLPTADARLFKGAAVELENLTAFLNLPTTLRKHDWKEEKASAEINRGDAVDAVIDGWTFRAFVGLQPFKIEQSHRRNRVVGDVTVHLEIIAPGPCSFDEIETFVRDITDLLTLAAGEPSGIISIRLRHLHDVIHRRPDRDDIAQPRMVESFAPRIHTATPDGEVKDRDFRFTCADSEFPEMLPKWLSIRKRAEAALNTYFGLYYAPPAYTESRLLFQAIAAEALHSGLYGNATDRTDEEFETLRGKMLDALDSDDDKAWVKQKFRNDPSLRERLVQLARKPDSVALAGIIPSSEDWARRLVKIRNGLAHRADGGSDQDLYLLEHASNALIVLVLMTDLGLSKEVQQRAAREPLRLH